MASRPILRSLGLSLTAVVLSACPGDSTEANGTDDETTDTETTETSDTDPTDTDPTDTDPDTTTTGAVTMTTNADTTTTDDPTEDTTTVDPTEGECGNGVIDDGEECDGDELDGATCVDRGFTEGRLACADDCTFDTSACMSVKPGCGDGVADDGEDCDGEDLAGEDCVSQGFDQGDLACAKDCTFDLSACETLCGNGVLDDGETCDGDELDGEDCATQGFAGGTLGCAADCSAYDTAACVEEDCDNGVDDNDDLLIDCDDPICAAAPECSGALELIVGCDPEFCTLTPGGGPNGGDLCSCTIPAARHPVSDDVADASCFIGQPAAELLFAFDPVLAFSVSTCVTTPGDSAVAVYGADPTPGGVAELGCNEDASPVAPPYCSELGDNAVGDALPVATLGAAELWISVDEYVPAEYWDGLTDRVIDIELIAEGAPEVCGDSVDNDFDGTTDCADDECADDIVCTSQVEALDGCDPTWCTFAADAGPNGGDLCTCVIPGGSHPTSDDFADASCFGFQPGVDLVWTYDTTGYATFTTTSCDADTADSAIAAFDGVPGVGLELACDEDATGEANFCSELLDSGNAGPGLPLAVPANNNLQILVDEWGPGDYWDGLSQRTLTIELLPLLPEICGDNIDNDADGDTDCADDECAGSIGCAPIEVLVGCDPGVCTLADGAGPNGGDLCTCVIPGGAHPLNDDIGEASCFGGGATGRDLVVSFATAGYTSYVATTCLPTSGDSSMAAFDGDPDAGGLELACSEDAAGDFSFCSEITDNGGAGGGLVTPVPNTGTLWLTIDEWNATNYWNGSTSRQFSVELIP